MNMGNVDNFLDLLAFSTAYGSTVFSCIWVFSGK
jgi:hypothetical protein